MLQGDAGNDVFVIGNALDTFVEGAGEGVDTLLSTVDVVAAVNFENIVLEGSEGLQATGNAVANLIYGNLGDNYIDGGAGADTMVGGAGDDVYVVDNVGDVVIELADGQAPPVAPAPLFAADNTVAANGFNSYGHVDFSGTTWGIDTVKASISYTLGANLENLVLTGPDAINGSGNALANIIVGNSSANRIDGGAGADSMSAVPATTPTSSTTRATSSPSWQAVASTSSRPARRGP